ncbi:MAG TPA: shikimate dehydrogenase [Bacteroidia bacterium]|jgi:shikimate dehydrogenase|nr:shikimate dehydrogenase [Bacteroidia bacterium]
MDIDAKTKICLIIGDPVAHSLSPAMHNAAYAALNLGKEYLFLPSRVKPEDLALKISEIRAATNLHAMAVTIPHKETIIKYLDKLDETAEAIGAVNTVVKINGKLLGYNTDCYGAIESLKRHASLNNKKVAVLGSGGSARAIVYGLMKENCDITVYSRNTEKSQELVGAFGCKSAGGEKINDVANAAIIINTTPIGRDNAELPISADLIKKGQIVFDINYNINDTALLRIAKEKGAIPISGLEMLLRQGMKQFEMYTGLKAPEEAMSNALKIKVNHADAI